MSIFRKRWKGAEEGRPFEDHASAELEAFKTSSLDALVPRKEIWTNLYILCIKMTACTMHICHRLRLCDVLDPRRA